MPVLDRSRRDRAAELGEEIEDDVESRPALRRGRPVRGGVRQPERVLGN
jgi:hypothetical protein